MAGPTNSVEDESKGHWSARANLLQPVICSARAASMYPTLPPMPDQVLLWLGEQWSKLVLLVGYTKPSDARSLTIELQLTWYTQKFKRE